VTVSRGPGDKTGGDSLHGLVEERLRQAAQRYTSGRRALVDLLAQAGHPLSIEDIAEQAPRMPRSSAYRHLVDLQQAGVVRRVAANDGYFRFELAEDITEHHHHLVCTYCGQVLDVTPTPAFEQAMNSYLASLTGSSGFVSDDHRLDVLGACATCNRARSARRDQALPRATPQPAGRP
jgi:Fe2+ or Zn2+ uptake regulation protein